MTTGSRIRTFLARSWPIIAVVVLTAIYTVVTFAFYWARTLDGVLQYFYLPGNMFGVPGTEASHGLTALFYGPGQTGWDGQFYYYMSNDLLGTGDAPSHMDSNAYRYQRVGLSLLAAIVAKVLLADWVSPVSYLYTYFALVLAATAAGAVLLRRVGVNPFWVLLWSLSVGTQVTLFNGLPDASADAFLIIALLLVHQRRYVWAVLPFVFSVLSREVYVVFPAFILAALFLQAVFTRGEGSWSWRTGVQRAVRPQRWWSLIVAVLAFGFWQVYVTVHFGVRPSEQAAGINGAPLGAWWQYLSGALRNDHPLVGSGRPAALEASSLIAFLVVLVLGLILAVRVATLRRRPVRVEYRAVAVALLLFCAVYASFGPVVIMHYTGYVKAIAVFFFAIPFLAGAAGWRWRTKAPLFLLMVLALGVTGFNHVTSRVLAATQPQPAYTRLGEIVSRADQVCLSRPGADVEVTRVRVVEADWIPRRLGRRDEAFITVTVTNRSDAAIVSTGGQHSTYLSYRWKDADGRVVGGSELRTALPNPVAPGQSTTATAVVYVPYNYRDLTLTVAPVQEQCSFFADRPNSGTYPNVQLPALYN